MFDQSTNLTSSEASDVSRTEAENCARSRVEFKIKLRSKNLSSGSFEDFYTDNK